MAFQSPAAIRGCDVQQEVAEWSGPEGMPGSVLKLVGRIHTDIPCRVARFPSGWPVLTSQNVVVGTVPGLWGVGEEQTKALQPLNGPLPGDTNERPEKRPRVCNPPPAPYQLWMAFDGLLAEFLIAVQPSKVGERIALMGCKIAPTQSRAHMLSWRNTLTMFFHMI